MERESFLFYRSFYEAIKCMPPDVQAEIYPAIMEYALLGKQPKNLSEVARGMFLLIKPNIDVNTTRFENAKKGGRKSRAPKKQTPNPDYNLTFEQEIDQMKADTDWTASVCEDYNLTPEEYSDRLKRFLKHCKDSRKTKPHDSIDDARSHLRYWMDKAFPRQASAPVAGIAPAPDIPDIGSDFGAADYDEQPSDNNFTPPFNIPESSSQSDALY